MSETRLTKSDLNAIQAQYEVEIQNLSVPVMSGENSNFVIWLERIENFGHAVTLTIAQFLQSFGALFLAVVFIYLEAERVNAGLLELGQHGEQAGLLAVGFTFANAVLPIYSLRNVQSLDQLTVTRSTFRGALDAFRRRLFFQPQTYQVDVNHNSILRLAETAITYAVLFLAFYSLLSPMLVEVADDAWHKAIPKILSDSSIVELIGLIVGIMLSIGGVFGVQSIAHEIGVRTITDKPVNVREEYQTKLADYENQKAEIWERIKADHVSAKIADMNRKKQDKSDKKSHDGMDTDFLQIPLIGGASVNGATMLNANAGIVNGKNGGNY